MKGFLTAHKGMEDVAAMEVNELIGSKASPHDSCVTFGIRKYDDLFRLCYTSQSALNVCFLLSEFSFDDLLAGFKNGISKVDFAEWLSQKTAFRVVCIKNSQNELRTQDIEKELGAIIIESLGKNAPKVDLDKPDIIIFVYTTEDNCLVGIDFSGFDISKRHYNIFSHPASVKGTIAYCLARLSGFKGKELILDPFSGSGLLPIEAALFASNFPVNYYSKEKFAFTKFGKFKKFNFDSFFSKIDRKISMKGLEILNLDASMKNISFAKKNAKIAGMDKCITYSRMELEWLDTKFEKGKVTRIATKMPSSPDPEKLYNEFFYQSEFILDDKGRIALIGKSDLVKKYSNKHKFNIVNERDAYSGKEKYEVFVLEKST